ncbi:hypothetical protein FCV25MIE_03193, partial [Fagus crenata]
MTNSVKIKRFLHSPTTKNYMSLHSIFFKVRPHSHSKESLSMIINFKECREHSVTSLTKIGTESNYALTKYKSKRRLLKDFSWDPNFIYLYNSDTSGQ